MSQTQRLTRDPAVMVQKKHLSALQQALHQFQLVKAMNYSIQGFLDQYAELYNQQPSPVDFKDSWSLAHHGNPWKRRAIAN